MKIDSYFSEQFAGMRSCEAAFRPGMNVVLGDNETGKSTMIAAIFYALTKGTRLDGRRDKNFLVGVFPSGGAQTVSAKVCFTENGKSYEVEKLWDKTGREAVSRLKEQDGDVVRSAQAEEKLAKLLRYGTAVYDNVIFGRQNHEEAILDWCYRFFSDKSETDIDAVRKQIGSALSAAGGISPEKLLAELDVRMKALDGHWDMERDGPEKNRGLQNPWRKGVGAILEAWYAYQEAEQNCQNAARTEQEIADTTRRLDLAQKEKGEISERYRRLLEQKNTVEGLRSIQKLKARAERDLKDAEFAQADWHRQEQRVRLGKEYLAFQQEAENRRKKDALQTRLNAIWKLEEEIEALSDALRRHPDIEADYKAVQNIPHRIELAETKLHSARLHASIRLKGGHTAALSSADGDTREVRREADLDINGYLRLDIPDVAEIQVAPRGVDVQSLQEEITENEVRLNDILRKYDAADLTALKRLADAHRDAESSLTQKKAELKRELWEDTAGSLRTQLEAIAVTPELPLPEDLTERIQKFLKGVKSLDAAVSVAEQKVREYAAAYTGQEALAGKIEELHAQVGEYGERLAALSAENILSSDEFDRRLQRCSADLTEAETQIGELQNRLGQLGEPEDAAGLEAERDRLQAEWLSRKREYAGYRRIRADFEALISQKDDSFSGFYSKFNEYLTAIAGETLTMEADDGLRVTSGRNRLNRELLSAGTKKTLLLAFRLAVLSCYFPDGDGLVVLDDDLLDMDPTRRERAAALLKRFAEKNQVIFITCDPSIAGLLGGNRVSLFC